MKDNPFFAVIYMFLVTAVLSSVVIGFASFTHDKVEANKQLAFEKAILEVFSLAEDKASVELHDTFIKSIRGFDSSGENVSSYVIDEKVVGYAIPVSGKGFWAKIKGVVGVDTDKTTITGVAFYEQNETPGLGAEITMHDFRNQFAGKKIAASGKPIEIKPVGSELNDNSVHAISGATQTCTRLEKLINDDLTQWRKGDKKISQ